MKNVDNPLSRRLQTAVYAATLAAALTVQVPTTHAAALTLDGSPASRAHIAVPPLPAGLEVPAGNEPFLLGKAVGTQNYVCLPAGVDANGSMVFGWKLFTPEATLYSGEAGESKQLVTHFFSPNPDELNADPLTGNHPVRATWQSSKDSSAVWARTMVPGDSAVVTPNAIPWLKLTVVGSEQGKGRDVLAMTTFIHRVNTTGGLAPAADTCDTLQEVGRQAYVPYTADYIFYTD